MMRQPVGSAPAATHVAASLAAPGLGSAGGTVLAGVREVPLTELQPWPENPRRIRPERLADLKQALVADRGDAVGAAVARAARRCRCLRKPAAARGGRAWLGDDPDRHRRPRPGAGAVVGAAGQQRVRRMGPTGARRAAGGTPPDGVDLALAGFGSGAIDPILAGIRSSPIPIWFPTGQLANAEFAAG